MFILIVYLNFDWDVTRGGRFRVYRFGVVVDVVSSFDFVDIDLIFGCVVVFDVVKFLYEVCLSFYDCYVVIVWMRGVEFLFA